MPALQWITTTLLLRPRPPPLVSLLPGAHSGDSAVPALVPVPAVTTPVPASSPALTPALTPVPASSPALTPALVPVPASSPALAPPAPPSSHAVASEQTRSTTCSGAGWKHLGTWMGAHGLYVGEAHGGHTGAAYPFHHMNWGWLDTWGHMGAQGRGDTCLHGRGHMGCT